VLGSERITTRNYPKWSQNLFKTFVKLTDCVPNIKFVYTNLNLDEQNIMQSANALQNGLTQAQKYKLACFISQHLVIVQRDYIVNMNKGEFPGVDFECVKSIFESTNMNEVRADLDGFLFLAQIA